MGFQERIELLSKLHKQGIVSLKQILAEFEVDPLFTDFKFPPSIDARMLESDNEDSINRFDLLDMEEEKEIG